MRNRFRKDIQFDSLLISVIPSLLRFWLVPVFPAFGIEVRMQHRTAKFDVKMLWEKWLSIEMDWDYRVKYGRPRRPLRQWVQCTAHWAGHRTPEEMAVQDSHSFPDGRRVLGKTMWIRNHIPFEYQNWQLDFP